MTFIATSSSTSPGETLNNYPPFGLSLSKPLLTCCFE